MNGKKQWSKQWEEAIPIVSTKIFINNFIFKWVQKEIFHI